MNQKTIGGDAGVLAGQIRQGIGQGAWDFVAYASVELLRITRDYTPGRVGPCFRSFAMDALRFARSHRAIRNQ